MDIELLAFHYHCFVSCRIAPRAPSVENAAVNENDLEHLLHLINGKGGEITWQHLMERSTSNMAYQAWRHDPEVRPVCFIFFFLCNLIWWNSPLTDLSISEPRAMQGIVLLFIN